MKDFNCWLSEYADFGMEQTLSNSKEKDLGDDPLHPLDIEYIIDYFKKKNLGIKNGRSRFFGEVQWGEDVGAVKLIFSPLGGLRVSLRRLTPDLEGTPTWICEKVIEVKHLFDEHPDVLSVKIQDTLVEMDQQDIKGPIADYDKLERFVLRLASDLRRRTTQRIFIYEGIRRLIKDEKYIIHFGVTGHGHQRVGGQKRLDQLAFFVEYNKETGIIKIAVNELGDKLDKYRFIYDPSTILEYFSPSQKEEEIINAILVCFNCY